MKSPLSLVHGNCVFGERLDDAWAAFALACSSYEWLSPDAKRLRMLSLISALEALRADVQLVRVSRAWRWTGYVEALHALAPAAHRERARACAQEQARRAQEVCSPRASLFLFVCLRPARRELGEHVSAALDWRPRERLRAVRAGLALRDTSGVSGDRLERARLRALEAHARLRAFLPVRPARSVELQWLVRRAFCRGLGEPRLERPRAGAALALRQGDAVALADARADMSRWIASGRVEERARCVRVESERGESWQAQLVLGALPEQAAFPGAASELMFAPLESLSFPVDVSLNARFVPNELALRIVRRRVQDADQIASAESDGDQGVSDLARGRMLQARELLAYLQSPSRPPLSRCTLALAVGASSERQLNERVEACRRAYGEIALHRPLGDQLPLFFQHLPAQRTRVKGYEDMLTLEQIGAMMPTATHAAGSCKGFYLGHTLSGSRQPVRLDLRDGSERDRNTTILSVGALGSGKTTLAQKLLYEGFLQGARVIDCDPKGDHRFHRLDEVAPHAETIALRPDAALRGLLDPLRIAPAHLRREVAVSFLCDLLPTRAEAAWETAVLAAVESAMRRCRVPTCLEVVRSLLAGEGVERQVGKALAVYAGSGLTQLGFADPARPLPGVGDRQVTYIPIRDLPAPEPGARRSEYTHAERIAQQIVRLIAMLAMHLLSLEPERLTLFGFDEGWRLLGDPVGRSLLASLQRMGRSELAVPIVSTQLVGDLLVGQRESLEGLLGATFVFGQRSPAEASRALALLGLDAGDRRAQRLLMELDAGRCLMRDHAGRVEAVQVELVSRSLVRAFSTTPGMRMSVERTSVE